VFVAVSNDSIAGWIVIEKRISLSTEFTSEITGLVVGSNFRRLGIGQLLVNAAAEWSQSLGLSQVVVRSNVSRLESHDFYQSIGFELKKTAHVYAKGLKKA
ncbi:GNAT family N-acetyltransferase, partial [Halomonas sp.]|uniref:GNAT family N-acetyltransferase n=1 Tax=Halomonas sp. TaxID=1486246 RepID=UPI0035651259